MIHTVKNTVLRSVQPRDPSSLSRSFVVLFCLLVPITLAMLPLLALYWSGNFAGDIANEYLPFKLVALKAFKSGEAPLWNPYLFSGAPLLADPQSSLLYPTQLLFLLLPPHIAFALVQYLHIVLLAVGTYKLLRLYCDPLPALAGSLAFTLSGPVFNRLAAGHYTIIQVLAWIPWIFLCLDRYWLSQRPFWLVAGGVAIALQLLAGFPTLCFFTLLAIGVYLIHHFALTLLEHRWEKAIKSTLWWGVMFLLAGMLSAAQWLPSLEFIALAGRALTGYAFVRQNSLPIVNIMTSVLPEIFGSALTHTAIQGAYWGEHSLYIGGLPPILSLIYVLRFRHHKRDGSGVYLLLAVMSIVLALGAHNPAYRLLFNYVPGFRQLAAVGRMTMLYAFFLSIVSAISIQHLADWLPSASVQTRTLLRWCAIVVSSLLVIALLVLTLGRGMLSAIAEPLILERYDHLASEKMQKLDILFLTQAASIFVFLCIVIAGGSLMYYRMRSRLSARMFAIFSLLIILVDVGLFALRLAGGFDLLLTGDRNASSHYTAQTPAYLTAFSGEPSTFRILPLNSMRFINQGSQFGIPAITGYNSLIMSSYLQFLGIIRGSPVDSVDRVPMIRTWHSPLLKILNVKYLVSYEPLQDPHLELLHSSDVYVYRMNQTDAAHAFMVYHAEYFDSAEQVAARMAESSFDPLRSVLLERRLQETVQYAEQIGTPPESQVSVLGSTLNSVTFEAYTSAPGWLVVSEIYYPGWRAYIDGQETPISKGDLVLRVVELSPGRHTVRFVYDPDTVRCGLFITVLGALLVVSLLLHLLTRSFADKTSKRERITLGTWR